MAKQKYLLRHEAILRTSKPQVTLFHKVPRGAFKPAPNILNRYL